MFDTGAAKTLDLNWNESEIESRITLQITVLI